MLPGPDRHCIWGGSSFTFAESDNVVLSFSIQGLHKRSWLSGKRAARFPLRRHWRLMWWLRKWRLAVALFEQLWLLTLGNPGRLLLLLQIHLHLEKEPFQSWVLNLGAAIAVKCWTLELVAIWIFNGLKTTEDQSGFGIPEDLSEKVPIGIPKSLEMKMLWSHRWWMKPAAAIQVG